jgi:hypothetical protein
MKTAELRKLIREEVRRVLKEKTSPMGFEDVHFSYDLDTQKPFVRMGESTVLATAERMAKKAIAKLGGKLVEIYDEPERGAWFFRAHFELANTKEEQLIQAFKEVGFVEVVEDDFLIEED